MMGRQKKRGFTLMETVVTVGIVASLAAVVYPQVVRQFDAADPTRTQNDLKNLQTAIEAFNVNLSGALPGDLDDLANLITTADSSLTTVASGIPVFTSAQVALWNGPYVDFSILEAAAESNRPSGFGALIQDDFVCYNSLDNTHGVSAATSATAVADDVACPGNTGQKFLTIQITGVTCSATDAVFLAINERFDGSSETLPTTNGRVRCEASGGGTKATDVDVLYFLAVPIA